MLWDEIGFQMAWLKLSDEAGMTLMVEWLLSYRSLQLRMVETNDKPGGCLAVVAFLLLTQQPRIPLLVFPQIFFMSLGFIDGAA